MKEKRNNQNIFLASIKYIASLSFAIVIIYLLFRNQDPVALIEKISEVQFGWIILSMIFGGCAYVNRGLRWIVLIEAMGYKSSKLNSLHTILLAR